MQTSTKVVNRDPQTRESILTAGVDQSNGNGDESLAAIWQVSRYQAQTVKPENSERRSAPGFVKPRVCGPAENAYLGGCFVKSTTRAPLSYCSLSTILLPFSLYCSLTTVSPPAPTPTAPLKKWEYHGKRLIRRYSLRNTSPHTSNTRWMGPQRAGFGLASSTSGSRLGPFQNHRPSLSRRKGACRRQQDRNATRRLE